MNVLKINRLFILKHKNLPFFFIALIVLFLNACMGKKNIHEKKIGEPYMQSTLIKAVEDEKIDEVIRLLNDGALINEPDSDGWLPFICASYCNNPNLIKILLEHGADINKLDIRNFSALEGAIISIGTAPDNETNTKVISLLLKNGANSNYINSESKKTPIIWASHYGSTGAVKLLLVNDKLNINAVDKNGSSALMEASYYRNPECVALLLEHGANPNLINKEGDTALDLAPMLDKTAVVQKPKKTAKIIALLKKYGGKTAKELKKQSTSP